MGKTLAMFAAASLAAGTLAFVGYDQSVLADAADRMGQMQRDTSLPQGISRSQQQDTQSIRGALATCTEMALSGDDLSQFSRCLASTDQKRLQDLTRGQDQELKNALNQFRQNWRQKYNQDFDIKPEVAFGNQYQGFQIVQGEVTNPALLSNWPVEPTRGKEMMHEGEEHMGDRVDREARRTRDLESDQDRPGQQAGVGGPGNPPYDVIPDVAERGAAGQTGAAGEVGERGVGARGLERGQNVALVTYPSGHGLPEMTVSLSHEGANRWNINIPDSVSSTELRNNIVQHLRQLNNSVDQWPNDVNEASRVVSHHIMAATYDVETAGGEGE